MNYIKRIYSGRIGRKNYILGWLFFSLLFLVSAAALLGAISLLYAPARGSSALILFSFLELAVLFAMWVVLAIHNFSLHVRRFHDIGADGLWSLFIFIPFIGQLVFIVLFLYKGNGSTNKYGKVPPKDRKFLDSIFNK